MAAYYNEIDRYCAEWLRNLMKRGHIADGVVDERSIAEVQPEDVAEFAQCHFFAGIGGWSFALRLAGWPDERPVWTGSCPCQPFSAAGKRKGTADERHLWPDFRRLIAECGPAIVFGEQVASKDGRLWLAGVRADLEALAYGVGGADLCAAGVGAPHIRQRLYWVADAMQPGRPERWTGAGDGPATGSGSARGLGNTDEPGPQGRREHVGEHADQRFARTPSLSFWSDHEWLPCLDGKARRIEPGSFPLAHGVPARVGRLRAYGNAISPQIAQAFITAWMETMP